MFDIDNDGYNALIFVVANEQPKKEIAEYLLQNGADINHKTKDGMSVVHYAIENADFLTVKLLVEKGADLNVFTVDGQSVC